MCIVQGLRAPVHRNTELRISYYSRYKNQFGILAGENFYLTLDNYFKSQYTMGFAEATQNHRNNNSQCPNCLQKSPIIKMIMFYYGAQVE